MDPHGFSGRRAEVADAAREMARAYAAEHGLPLTSVVVRSVTVVGTDKPYWAQQLRGSLSVGLVSGAGAFRAVGFAELDDVLRVTTDDHRSVADIPEAIIAPGDAIAEIIWEFESAAPPVTSYAVFSGDRRLVFDTLVSMPVLPDFAAMPLTLG
jgi:hypothetical protein